MTNPRFQLPRAAYVHVPFCRHRCGYCNFTLIAGRDDLIEEYLSALERELSTLETPQVVETLFLGGGTPSHLPPWQLGGLLASLGRWLPLAEGHEFTVEANPSDVTAERLALLRSAGANRISLGAQSFRGEKLRFLERDHGAGEVERAVSLARGANFHVSLDLIFGVPGETVALWREDLRKAVELAPDHLSTYALTYERGTRFWSRLHHGLLPTPCDEMEERLYATAIDRLADAGFEHYEVSNFARAGRKCRHNLTYWDGGTYHAFGPGAARHVDGRREVNHRGTTTYLRRLRDGQSPVAERERLTPQEAALERLVFGIRQLAGVDGARFQRETGFAINQIAGEAVRELTAAGLLEVAGDILRVTRAGLMVCDSIAERFLRRPP